MAEREHQNILVSRQGILLVTAMGVGLLTLSYVLGVQVGKQSAALRKPAAKTLDEQLKEMPEPLAEQLKNFETSETMGMEKTPRQPPPSEAPKAEDPKAEAPKPEAKPTADKQASGKPTAEKKPEAKAEDGKWTLQLVATGDAAEAKRVAEKARAAGFTTTITKEKGQHKVRLAKPASRADMDAAAAKLKGKGLKAFAVKAD